uniref:Uncharacterized protein n=1 Tax=Eptatretus burgeri TaxID=7764 RepID=A0A8C4WYC6_EPTBU
MAPVQAEPAALLGPVPSAAPPASGHVSLGALLDLTLQRTYHDTMVLAELLPRKTDLERKIEIVCKPHTADLCASPCTCQVGRKCWQSGEMCGKRTSSVYLLQFRSESSFLARQLFKGHCPLRLPFVCSKFHLIWSSKCCCLSTLQTGWRLWHVLRLYMLACPDLLSLVPSMSSRLGLTHGCRLAFR